MHTESHIYPYQQAIRAALTMDVGASVRRWARGPITIPHKPEKIPGVPGFVFVDVTTSVPSAFAAPEASPSPSSSPEQSSP